MKPHIKECILRKTMILEKYGKPEGQILEQIIVKQGDELTGINISTVYCLIQ